MTRRQQRRWRIKVNRALRRFRAAGNHNPAFGEWAAIKKKYRKPLDKFGRSFALVWGTVYGRGDREPVAWL